MACGGGETYLKPVFLTIGFFESDNEKIWVLTKDGKRIARFSKKAASLWKDRINNIQFATITAIVTRFKSMDDEKFAQNAKFDQWEVPIIDVVF